MRGLAVVAVIVAVMYVSIGVLLAVFFSGKAGDRGLARIRNVVRFAPAWPSFAVRMAPMLRFMRIGHRGPGPAGSEAWHAELERARNRFFQGMLDEHVRRCRVCRKGQGECGSAAAIRKAMERPLGPPAP